ncbi:MAG: response regulator transcription factor [Spirochaetaceae bacterium]|jgi:two-component system alkaline phosphatase synthesis response regulator PhoP|nr:response regulator transcription factor [Spirochaetaceae bacterium]
MAKIFAVEDDDNIRELVLYALKAAGFDAYGFHSAKPFYASLNEAESPPRLILLDIMLQGEDGVSILKRLKADEKHRSIPVIMLTARNAEYDRIKGLDLGADDYITKPFSIMELIARIRAVLRRCAPQTSEAVELKTDSIILNTNKRNVYINEKEILLTYKEFELLRYLIQNKGLVLTREKILEHVWGYEFFGESRTVDMHIKSLRQKLKEKGEIIKTVRNVGYKINE